MRFVRWLRLVRQVARRTHLKYGAAIAAAVFGERLLGPVLVHMAAVGRPARALAVGTALTFVFALRGLLQSAYVSRTEAGLYARVVDSVLRQDVLKQSVLPDEEARAALFEGARGVASLLAEGLPNLFANALAGAIFGVVIIVSQPAQIALVAVLAGALGALLLAAPRGVIQAAQSAESSAWIDLADGIGDAFDGRLELVAGGRPDDFAKRFAHTTSLWSSAATRAARIARLAGRLPLVALAAFVGGAVMLDSILHGESTRQMLERGALLASMSPAFVGIAHGLQEIARSDPRVNRILALIRVDSSAARGRQPPGEIRNVEMRNLHFWYERGRAPYEALRGVSLTWRAGELLALAGPNGSGKSTVLRAMLGLGPSRIGELLVDDVPIERIDIEQWRQAIAFLPQRAYLPPRSTVRECLRFVDADVADDVMTAAIEQVGLSALLRGDGASPLDARIDELSVGQRQRIGLARALCRKARMFVLDEPDANLDRAGVELVAGLVRELARDAMVVFAAHSAELLTAADRVITLDIGRIASSTVPERAQS